MSAQLFRPFENLLNRGISASREAQRLNHALTGRRLRVELQGLPVSLQITATDQGIALSDRTDDPADCTLSGLPLSLARLGLTGDPEVFRQRGVSISGDPVLAQDFRRLLDLARPDWEEELSRLVGDVAAHQLGNAARGLLSWTMQAADTLGRDASEFLREESRNLPTRFEVDEFLDQVDELGGDVDRAEARLCRLERKSTGQTGASS